MVIPLQTGNITAFMGSSGYLKQSSKRIHCNDSSLEANINDTYLITMKQGVTKVRPLNTLQVYNWHPLRLHVNAFQLNHDPAIFNNTDILHKDDQMHSILASGLSFSVMPASSTSFEKTRSFDLANYSTVCRILIRNHVSP